MAIELIDGEDYVLPEGLSSVWVGVDNISIWICRMSPDGSDILVQTFPLGEEADTPMDTIYINGRGEPEPVEMKEIQPDITKDFPKYE